jgi:pimeloyl-ACP methyl ester carboxylesterase
MRALLATEPMAGGAQSCTLDVDGAALHYLDAGAGEPVVLIHGGGGGGANWFRLIGPLSTTHRVLAPDLPGFGLSAERAATGSLGGEAAKLLTRWLDRIGVERATVVGTSFGGLTALRLAQTQRARVARLALISSAGLGREATWLLRVATLPLLGPVLVSPSRPGTALLFRRLLTTDRSQMSKAQQQALVEYLFRSASVVNARSFARTLRRFAGVHGQREVVSAAELAQLDMPAAVIWGRRDRLLPTAHAEAAAAALPNAVLTIIDHSGHSPNWETPGDVLAAMRALLERSPS